MKIQFDNQRRSHVLATGRTSEDGPKDHLRQIETQMNDYNCKGLVSHMGSANVSMSMEDSNIANVPDMGFKRSDKATGFTSEVNTAFKPTPDDIGLAISK